jgi:hypothetical protein
MKRFHIGYYIAEDKKMISGKTYIAENIIHAIEQYLTEQKDELLIKYVVEMDDYVTSNS